MTYRRRSILPLLIVLLAFALRLYRLDVQSIWWDEGHSIYVATQPISHIPTLPAMDVHPPGYFALLHLWLNLAGPSEFALRYLSVIFSLLTITLLWRFAAKLSSPHPTTLLPCYPTTLLPYYPTTLLPYYPATLLPCSLVTLFAALSPLYVAYAQEVRGYAMLTFFATASTLLLWQFLMSVSGQTTAKKSNRFLLFYIILTAASLYIHYFTIFLLIFQNLVWLAWVGWQKLNQLAPLKRTLALWFGSQIGVLLLFLPQLLLAVRQITSYTNPNLSPPSLTHFILRSWQAYTTGLTLNLMPARWGMGLIAAVLLISWLLHFWFNPTKQATSFLFLTAWIIVPLAAYFMVLQRQPSFEPRYLMLVTPALFLLLGLGLGQVARAGCQVSRARYQVSSAKCQVSSARYQVPRTTHHVPRTTQHAPRSTQHAPHTTHHTPRTTHHAPRFTFYSLLLLTLLVLLTGLYNTYTNENYFKGDSAGVAAWLAAQTTPNDIVYVDVPHPFHYYDARIPAPTRYLFVDIHTAADILNREAVGRNRLYWITWSGSDTDPRGVISFLAEKAGRQLGRRDFRGYHVEWFSLPTDNTIFSVPTELAPLDATFGNVLRLDGVAYSNTTTATDPAWATFHFTLLHNTEVDYKVSVRVRGEDGQTVSHEDHDLLNDRHFRTSAWPPDDPALNQALNVYTLPLAAGTPPGDYRLEVVVYNSRPPYPSEGVSGHPSADGAAALIGIITVTP